MVDKMEIGGDIRPIVIFQSSYLIETYYLWSFFLFQKYVSQLLLFYHSFDMQVFVVN